ncbi:outer membrane protein assembly factor BamB family protein [Pseudomonas sp. CGJS7]|uniref:outer membrane protein assembly factor BamB family protein n=1 Tax=Pseudomonas sp. CGJS7 TaxID=3109348 RepID=UPI00300A132E
MKSLHVTTLVAALGLSGFAAAYFIGDAAPGPQGAPESARKTLSAQSPSAGKADDGTAARQILFVEPGSFSLTSEQGEQVDKSLKVTYNGRGGFIFAEPDNATFIAHPSITWLGRNKYRVDLRTSAGLAAGTYRGFVDVRVCRETPCVNIIPGAQALVAYEVIVKSDGTEWVNTGEWRTFQRNAAHDGYIPVKLKPERFAYKWEWKRTTGTSADRNFINSVATEDGQVFVSEDVYAGQPWLYSLNEADGTVRWKQQFVLPDRPALNPPATAGGKVFLTTTGHSSTFLWGFNAATGAAASQSAFSVQWDNQLAPTVHKNLVYINGGYYGGTVLAYDFNDGQLKWQQNSGGDDDMATPAVDDNNVYHYDGIGLKVYNATTGASVANINDPYQPEQGYSYHSAPMLGSADNVIAFSGGAFSGMASSSAEQYGSRPLVNYSVTGYNTRWRSEKKYLTQPATAGGVIYAGSNNPKSFDAIDEATGQVLWSWVPGPEDTEFHRNVVLTKNLAFVSTNRAVYAIDLATHQPVWSYPVAGMLAVSGNGMLYIVEGSRTTTGRLIAITLK